MNATIKDVAKAAGVSVATVSRVLNNSATVSTAATEQVNSAIKELGYSPNFLGRNLRKCETNIILAVIPSTEHTFYSGIIKGMQAAANENGYDILMSTTNSNLAAEMRMLKMVFNRTVDAAVLLGTQLDKETLMDLNDKYNIAICCERVEGADVLTVKVDDVDGAYTAVKHLADCGHKKIAMISTQGTALSSVDREKGYMNVLKDMGIKFKDEYIYRGSYDYTYGSLAMDYFMSLSDPPTAIFCISDMIAVGAAKRALELELNVGEDISICGFDNLPISAMYTPGITTIEQPCYEIGRTVIEELLQNIQSGEKSNKQIMLNFSLVSRKSVKNFNK